MKIHYRLDKYSVEQMRTIRNNMRLFIVTTTKRPKRDVFAQVDKRKPQVRRAGEQEMTVD